jgi:hypothetical protein
LDLSNPEVKVSFSDKKIPYPSEQQFAQSPCKYTTNVSLKLKKHSIFWSDLKNMEALVSD